MDETKYYLGRLCKRGHDHEGTGQSLRYKWHNCVECIKENKKSKKFKEYKKEYMKEYNRSEKFKEYKKEYMKSEKAKKYHKEYRQTPDGKLVMKRGKHKRRALKVSTHIPFTSAQIRVRFDLFRDECAYCGSPDKITIDHIEPISKNGLDAIENLAPACQSCNCSKSATPMEAWYRAQAFFSETRLRFIHNAMKPPVKKNRASEAQQVRLF